MKNIDFVTIREAEKFAKRKLENRYLIGYNQVRR